MYHNFLLVQKIQENDTLKVYFAQSDYINWTYEEFRKPFHKTDTPLFPIIITNDDVLVKEKPIGRETSCIRVNPKRISFADDYGVPEGFLICITGPIGYMPSVIKFKQKPFIGSEDYNRQVPGQYEVLTNRTTKQASILMHTLGRSFFGICVDFEESEEGFKKSLHSYFNDPFDITLSLVNGKMETISSSQIKQIIPNIEKELLVEFVDALNELVVFMKNADNRFRQSNLTNIKEKISRIVNMIIATGSSTITIVDSYHNNGFAAELIKAIFNFFT